VVMGKGSGIDSIHMWLQKAGIQASDEDAMKILQAVKAHSLKSKKLLTEAEFKQVADGVLKKTAA
jgi:isopropylmalate/homocitrate/citramalate synthase